MTKPQESTEKVDLLGHIIIYPFFWCLFGLPIVVGGFGLYAFAEVFEKSNFTIITGKVAFVTMFIWFFVCMPWLAFRATLAHLGTFRCPFFAAAMYAINEGRMKLSLLPVVGSLLGSPFRDDEESEDGTTNKVDSDDGK